MKNCSTCDHSRQPQGGWCYMFREEPITEDCAKHTTKSWVLPGIHMPNVPAAFQDTMRSLIPGPDVLVKFAQIGLNSYQELHAKTTEVVSSAADSVADAASSVVDAGSSVLTTAGEAASAGMDAVCSVGEVAGDIASGCADIASSIID